MLRYPFDETFQRVQPFLMLDETAHVKVTARSAPVVVKTATGAIHRFGPLASFKTLSSNAAQKLFPAAEEMLRNELPRQISELTCDPLAYFAGYLHPVFSHRDWSEETYTAAPVVKTSPRCDWNAELARIARNVPLPALPPNTLWICGRAWKLQEQQHASQNSWQVMTSKQRFGLSGEYFLVGTLAANWKRQVIEYVAEAARQLASRHDVEADAAAVATARLELAAYGFIERADLLFLPGNPPRLGHLLPPHYNTTQQRHSIRDLAMTAPLTMPPTAIPSRAVLTVYERTSGSWRPASLPNGLCLGPDALHHEQESPGIGLAAYLRWAAERLAENGAFHSSDGTAVSQNYGNDDGSYSY